MPKPGTIGWIDLTVPDAGALRSFYAAVVGWVSSSVSMGGYHDFNMRPGAGEAPVAGICHARGVNAGLPAQWLMYITVKDLDASLRECRTRGGVVLREATSLGPSGRYGVIRDPAGAVAALFQPAHA